MTLTLVLALTLAQGSSTMVGPPPAAVQGGGVADYYSSLLSSNPVTECDCTNLLTSAAESVTTTRGSAAFCTASTGAMTSCTNNKPRVSNSGLLVEGSRTNLLLRSQEFDNATWATGNVGTGTAPTVTANAAVAPDGTTTAEQIVFGAVASGSNGSWIQQAVTMTAAAHGASIYMKGASGTGTAYFFGTPDNSTYLTVACAWNSSTWTQCTGAGTATGASWNWRIGSDGRAAAMSGGMAAQTIYVWGGQVELGAYATSYIPTAGTAVARSAENISLTPSVSINNVGCIAATVTDGDGAGQVASSFDGSLIAILGTTRFYTYEGGGGTVNSPVTTSIVSRATPVRAWWSSSLSQKGIDVDALTGTAGVFGTTMVPSALFLGSNTGGSGFLDGYIKKIKLGTTRTGCSVP